MFDIATSNVCSAFDADVVGTKVTERKMFMDILSSMIETAEFNDNGHAFITLTDYAHDCVTAGVGEATSNPDDYVLAEHRGQVSAYLKRSLASKVEGVAVVLYTYEGYITDADILGDEVELARIKELKPTHVIVAILAFAGPKAPLSPGRFTANLAGGNRDFADYDKAALVKMAKEIDEYHSKWCVVAD